MTTIERVRRGDKRIRYPRTIVRFDIGFHKDMLGVEFRQEIYSNPGLKISRHAVAFDWEVLWHALSKGDKVILEKLVDKKR